MFSSKLKKQILLVFAASGLIFYSCANIGMPTGGAYDLDPPKLIKVHPKAKSTNVRVTKFVLDFDENVVLKEPSEKIIVTPPQRIAPIIRSANRKVTVVLRDTLIPDMTYTVDFTDAITDNNEGNTLESFSYTFSTGDHIDTLAISGIILTADNLEPVKGMYVGLHSNLSDTAFTKLEFERISRTNDQGKFTVRGIAPGKYRVFGLNDLNRDYKYDNPDEAIAFYDSIIVPTTTASQRYDTIRHVHGDLTIDSISTVGYTRFLPDDVLLRSFKSDFQRKYLIKSERLENSVSLYFGAPTDMPRMKALNFNLPEEGLGLIEKTVNNDTIKYWLTDTDILLQDTLKIELSYLRTDSLNLDQLVTDTLKIFDRTRKREPKKKNKKEEEEEPKIEFIKIDSDLNAVWDIYKNINISFSQPLKDDLASHIRLDKEENDSVSHPIDIELSIDSINPRKYIINNKWDYDTKYNLKIDSATVHGIYGLWNDKFDSSFKVRKLDEYGNLGIFVEGLEDSIPAFVELLNKSDSPVRKAKVTKRGTQRVAVFKDIIPGIYYARILLDANDNDKWDTGNYEKKLQAEMVSYYKEFFDIKAFFDITQTWIVDTERLEGQKPLDITKNKPKDKDEKLKTMQEKEEQRQREASRR